MTRDLPLFANPRLSLFLDSLDAGNSEFLDALEEEAIHSQVPIIRRDTQRVLRTLLKMKKPGTVLEIGTAVGFSALLICENSEAHVTTIENYEKRIPIARENFRKAGMEERITFLTGDAGEILPGLDGSFDLIFMDAAKGQYIHFLREAKRLLAEGGVLISDNCLQDGDLLESHYAIDRRDRTIYKRMREYLTAISRDPELETVILPLGDGLAVSVKQSLHS
ncbi:MAG: O-methyltransferase [Lachnospiraceae bacterium]|nr:O-methyltransferase [Lachnospiraceae bacterium]